MFRTLLTHDNLARVWAACMLFLFGNSIFALSNAVFDGRFRLSQVSFMFWIDALVIIGIVFMAFVALLEKRALEYVAYGILVLMLGSIFLDGSSGGLMSAGRVPWSGQLLYVLLATGSFGFSMVDMRDTADNEVMEEVS